MKKRRRRVHAETIKAAEEAGFVYIGAMTPCIDFISLQHYAECVSKGRLQPVQPV
jgi:pyruvate/2-oxoacid:ferredoxin oxidoreductase beta subunit